MEAGSSRRNFIRRSLFGAAIGGLLSRAGAASNSDETESRLVDRRRLGRIDAHVSILGLGLGGEFMRGYVGNVEAGHALLESALAQGINYWDTARDYAGILIECMKLFDPDAVLTIFPCTRPDKGRYEDELLPLARSRKIGLIAMKTIRYARQANFPPKEFLRYALSLDGVHTAIVGLDSLAHLNENASVASNFRPMKQSRRDELYQSASRALAGIVAPWDSPGYLDGSVIS